jgi:two-component system sensor histidine kinase/response regulator
MTENSADNELKQLRSRVASLEQLEKEHERSARQSLEELRQRAQQLERSEETHRSQTQILQAILRNMGAGVIVANETGKFLLFNPEAERLLGIGAADVDPADWAQRYGCYLPDMVTPYPSEHLPLARAIRGEEVDDLELFIRNANRPEGLWLSVNARPLRDEEGVVRGGLCVYRDVTREKEAARRLAVRHTVTRILADSATLSAAAPSILEAICENAGWDLGALWTVDRQAHVLRCIDVWHRQDAKFAGFENLTRRISLPPGIGLPGIVWSKQKPIWAPDISAEIDASRAETATQNDLHASLAVPILFGREVTGVIEFVSKVIRKPDEELLAMLGDLGSQIGQFRERRRAEKDLHKSRERFELAMQGSGDGLWDWDLETGEVYYSPRWKGALGHEDHEIRNVFEEWEKRLHFDDRDRALATLQAYLEGKTPTYELEHRLKHKDGSYRWILARGVALRDTSGKPYRMAGSHTDITARKQAEEAVRNSEALYHSLVETLPLHVFRKDLNGKFTFGNQLFCQTLGKPLDQIRGKTDFDFYPEQLAEKYRQDDGRVIEEQVTVNAIEEHRKPSGERIYVQVLKTPVYDSRGQVIGTQGIFWDVTDRKLAEEELQKAKEAAESANRAKSVFLANMSHEIRTPMNAIIGMTELVLGTSLGIEQREYLDLVKKSADSLLSVINDILDFSKVEAGKLDLDIIGFPLRDHLGDTLNTLAPRAYQKGLELACHVAPDVPDALLGDPVRLGQILVNLVGNALKFTERGEVVVDVAAGQRTETEVSLHFAVSDTGIGVPPDKLAFIFDPFAQADGSTTRKYGGTGLGLAIAKRLVERMGGQIWIESEVGKGSVFHFTAHLQLQKSSAKKPAYVEAAAMREMAVLVVDDNATNRRILEETLQNWQMKPTLAESGPAALHAMLRAARAGEPFPLVLIDVHMPDMDGYMLAEEIQQHPELAGAALMMLTSGGQPGDSKRRQELGIGYALTKPIKQADLWRAIMQALGMPLAQEEAAPRGRDHVDETQRLSILLAEDNLVNQKLAVRLLEKRGHRVVVANNGQEALAAAQSEPFDVILMDVQMPVMDGFEATAAIRRQEQVIGRHTPIIAMTAYAMKDDREHCLAAGMDRYISKPIRAQELFQSVEGAVAGASEEPATGETAEATSDVLDKAAALARAGEDQELLRELAELFLYECPRIMTDIHAAIGAGDAFRLKCAAHSLKGSIDNFAAPAAHEAASRLENLGRNGNLAGAQEAWSALTREIGRLQPILSRLAGKAAGQ